MTTASAATARELNPRTTLALVIAVAVFAGGNFTALKFASDHASPLFLTGLRACIGGPVLFVVARLRGETLPRSPRLFGHIFVVSLTVTTMSSAPSPLRSANVTPLGRSGRPVSVCHGVKAPWPRFLTVRTPVTRCVVAS